MKKITIINYSNDNSLFSSILFLLFGIILFTNPGDILKFISYIAGGSLILIGLFNIINYRKILKNLNIEQKSKLISGIILITLGLVTILFSSLIETTIRLIFGGWIIYSGIMRLIEVLNNKENSVSFIARLVVSILLIICGLYVALTDLVYSMIGLFIIIYAILDIVGYIFYKKEFKKMMFYKTSFLYVTINYICDYTCYLIQALNYYKYDNNFNFVNLNLQ